MTASASVSLTPSRSVSDKFNLNFKFDLKPEFNLKFDGSHWHRTPSPSLSLTVTQLELEVCLQFKLVRARSAAETFKFYGPGYVT